MLFAQLATATYAQATTDAGLGKRSEVGGLISRGRQRRRCLAAAVISKSCGTGMLPGSPALLSVATRAFASNANLFARVIAIETNCPKAIRLQVCYF
jgi:hypothetical protein